MTLVIILAAVFFLGMSLFALARPAALIRPFGITLPIPESRAEVRAVYGGFGRRNSAGEASRITRFSPDFALTLRPGFSTVPRAERVMPATLRSSTAMVCHPVASRFVIWCRFVARRSAIW